VSLTRCGKCGTIGFGIRNAEVRCCEVTCERPYGGGARLLPYRKFGLEGVDVGEGGFGSDELGDSTTLFSSVVKGGGEDDSGRNCKFRCLQTLALGRRVGRSARIAIDNVERLPRTQIRAVCKQRRIYCTLFFHMIQFLYVESIRLCSFIYTGTLKSNFIL
jgi:hypothetical protein